MRALPFYLRDVPYGELEAAWARAVPDPNDHAQIRRVCFADRFYLLVKVLRRADLMHPFLYERCREVEASSDDHLDLWARGHGKSSIITFGGVIQEVLRNPEITICILSQTGVDAKKFIKVIKREFEDNLYLQRLFPHIFYANPQDESPSWSEDGGLIVRRRSNPKEPTICAHGLVDGQPTGSHFSILVQDDVVTEQSVGTPEQIEKTTMMWSLADHLGTPDVRKQACGTRYHWADTYAEMLELGVLKLRKYPATHDGTLTGVPVWFTPDQWAKKKKYPAHEVATQLLLDPQAAGQRMFDLAAISRWEVRPRRLSICITCDPAHSMRKDSDHTAIAVIGIDKHYNKYFLDGCSHHMLVHDKWCWVRDLRRRWLLTEGVVSVVVGYEKIGADSDLQYFEQQMEIEGDPFEIVPLAWPRSGGGSKIDRVQRLTGDFQQDKLHLPFRNGGKLTRNQRRYADAGQEELIAAPIKALDENNCVYDVLSRLELQISEFPFCKRKDLIDALARYFDMELSLPISYEDWELEPAVVF